MRDISEGTLLWEPSEAITKNANLTKYMKWLAANYDLHFQDYGDLWQWSVDELSQFWKSLWHYFEVESSEQPSQILANSRMPGAEWFTNARLNYAENFFARMSTGRPAILYKAEDQPIVEISWAELYEETAALADSLRSIGVRSGDRVVAYMPHIPETIIALMAVSSLGAIWSSCSPDFGSRSVLDRFQQIEPKVLITVDGYKYNGRIFNRRDVVIELQDALPTLEKTILVPLVSDEAVSGTLTNTTVWTDLVTAKRDPSPLHFEQVPFDHPLWVLYSSGTTGLPKPIVHGHGGILMEHLKESVFQLDLKPEDRFFWYTSTGWMMWNFLVGGLLSGSTIVIYNGSPGYPDMNVLWQLAEEAGITYFGASAAFVGACIKAKIKPSETYDLTRIRAFGSTGSPLSIDGFRWIYEHVNGNLALESVSGGTDLCTAFVGGARLKPIYAGELQGASLGAKIEAFNEEGLPVVEQVGELVITAPMPSMPLYFWNDPDNRRYIASYFDTFPGVWRHGDWIKVNERGGCIIYGRSDSTINRQGIRMGTSEIYQAVESLPEILDSLIIDLELLGRESYMPLFVVLPDGLELNKTLKQKIKKKIRQDISPRHVPNDIFVVNEVPYTLSGKKMEVPVRRILLGQDLEKAANLGAMRNPESIQYFVDFAVDLQQVA